MAIENRVILVAGEDFAMPLVTNACRAQVTAIPLDRRLRQGRKAAE
jgi:hypothetical protein